MEICFPLFQLRLPQPSLWQSCKSPFYPHPTFCHFCLLSLTPQGSTSTLGSCQGAPKPWDPRNSSCMGKADTGFWLGETPRQCQGCCVFHPSGWKTRMDSPGWIPGHPLGCTWERGEQGTSSEEETTQRDQDQQRLIPVPSQRWILELNLGFNGCVGFHGLSLGRAAQGLVRNGNHRCGDGFLKS